MFGKIAIFLLVVASVPFGLNFLDQTKIISSPESSVNQPSQLELKAISMSDRTYRFILTSTLPNTSITLGSNLKAKQNSSQIINDKQCTTLVSGGFYDKKNQPIGWFVIDGKQLSSPQKNMLFNGYVYIYQNKFNISDTIPQQNPDYAIQSGPLLITNNQIRDLELEKDEGRRRIVAATTNQEESVFIVIMGDQNNFEGPLLKDLPNIVENIAEQEGFALETAINLDGGSASTFYNQDQHIKELTYIGSYFCLR